MSMSKSIASSLALGMLWSAAFAAQGTTPDKAPVASPATATTSTTSENDCQKVGGEVSALIDKERTSPNISAARAVFQRGIMDCMEGDQFEANKLYQEAKKLLNSDRLTTPTSSPKP